MDLSILQSTSKRSPWPYILSGSLLTVVVVNIGFLIIALRQPVLLVDKRPYESGLSYESKLADKQLLHDLGVDFSASFQPGDDELKIQVLLFNADRRAVEVRKVTFESLENSERSAVENLRSCGENSYCALFRGSSGWWRVELEVHISGTSIFKQLLVKKT